MSEGGLREATERLTPQLVAWRRDLHQHPELGFDLPRTAGFVEQRLRELGLHEVRTGIGRSGVVGILRAADRRGPGVLLRADMDALPLQEVEGREYGSKHAGRMHACGHDGHTAMLLGAATLLAERRAALTRDVVLCFQPAEEGPGGAREMIADGVLELVEIGRVFAVHLWSTSPAGTLEVRPGPAMAAQDEFTAHVVGRGGHGALPHQALDPIVAAAQAVTALQSIVSRSVDPIQPAVVSVGSIHAGDAPNIIPERVTLEGTLRSFDETVRETLRRRVPEVFDGVARAAGCRSEFELRKGYPALVNDPESVELLRAAAREVFGAEHVHEPPPMAGAEDFAYFLRERPGAFAFVGAGNAARGITAPHHSPRFDIDESALPLGAALLTRLALSPDLTAAATGARR